MDNSKEETFEKIRESRDYLIEFCYYAKITNKKQFIDYFNVSDGTAQYTLAKHKLNFAKLRKELVLKAIKEKIYSTEIIADILGLSEATVTRLKEKLYREKKIDKKAYTKKRNLHSGRIKRQLITMFEEGMTTMQISKELRLSGRKLRELVEYFGLRKYVKKNRKIDTQKLDELIRKYPSGSSRKIAALVGCNDSYVRIRRRKILRSNNESGNSKNCS